MSKLKGFLNTDKADTEDVTVTKSGNKVGLDTTIVGGSTSTGTGTGLELEGENALASGSILYGLEYKRIIKQTSPDAVTDIYNIYSDSSASNLISILTIIYETNAKSIVIDAKREDQ